MPKPYSAQALVLGLGRSTDWDTARTRVLESRPIHQLIVIGAGRAITLQKCRFRNVKCHNCGKVGHIKAACRSSVSKGPEPNERTGQGRPQSVKLLQEPVESSPEEEYQEEYALFSMETSRRQPPFEVELMVDGQSLTMEIDTGAFLSVETYMSLRYITVLNFQSQNLPCTRACRFLASGSSIEKRMEYSYSPTFTYVFFFPYTRFLKRSHVEHNYQFILLSIVFIVVGCCVLCFT